MKLHSLKPAAGSVKKGKRIARGQGSGHGGTATRGHKGAASRSGYSRKRGFEGGQMPLQRRLPKRGFKNINRVEYVAINFSNLEAICEKFQVTTVDPEFLYNNGFIKKTERIKILANGDLKSALKISAHASSAKAKLTIEELGGSLTII